MALRKLAAAQVAVQPGNIPTNVARHVAFADRAAAHGCRLVVFPELSLLGYELALASRNVLAPDHAVLNPLREVASSTGATLIVGAPLRGIGDALHIGAILFHPDGTTTTHTKVHVHSSEMHVFQPGPGAPPILVDGDSVALAICADASHPQHAALAAAQGACIYAAGVMITEDAIERKSAFLAQYAEAHAMLTLLANFSGVSGGEISGGRSAIWAPGGRLVASAPGNDECLVLAAHESDCWSGQVLPF
jgi:predicted amidohydrolase